MAQSVNNGLIRPSRGCSRVSPNFEGWEGRGGEEKQGDGVKQDLMGALQLCRVCNATDYTIPATYLLCKMQP